MKREIGQGSQDAFRESDIGERGNKGIVALETFSQPLSCLGSLGKR